MRFHDLKLPVAQPTRFEQDAIGNADLADIVQRAERYCWYPLSNGGTFTVCGETARGFIMKIERITVMVVCLAMLPWMSPSALGKKKNKTTPPPEPAQQQPVTPPVNSGAVTAAQKELADARAALVAATKKAQADFEASPEYAAADKEVKDAQTAYDAALAPVMEKMQKDPSYIEAKAKSDKAQAAVAELRSNSAPDDQVAAASQEAMEANSAMHQLQTAALADDPAVGTAHAKLMDAEKAKAALVTQFHAKLGEDPAYAAAKSAVDAATQKLAAAQKGNGA